uniref:Uncharacterized protein n=1 Tax=Peronospora matthiolae TaxID=2874970 RepID=A0AAV1UUZ8_9STRA
MQRLNTSGKVATGQLDDDHIGKGQQDQDENPNPTRKVETRASAK